MEQYILYAPAILAIIGLFFMGVKYAWVQKQDAGNERMQELSKSIKEGALAFLSAEYRLLLVFVIIASILLGLVAYIVPSTEYIIILAFIVGAVFSALAGNIGMRVATDANARTTQAARTSLGKGLERCF